VGQTDATVDTNTPNAAPEGVYQSERYGKDFTYTFPVPAGQRYTVRLHFAEVFDSGVGERLENIYINRRQVLTNLDIFAEVGEKKALVKEFKNIRPSRRGSIAIRITTTDESPDKNAKISGIEILKQEPAGPTAAVPPYVISTADGVGAISIETSAAPELTDWAQHTLAPVLAEWYPKIVALLPSDGFTAPAHFNLTIQPMDGVAYTTDTNIFASSSWCSAQIKGEAVGSIVHELVHVAQQYHSDHAPGWLVEGMADYIRWFLYEPQSHGADIVWMQHHGKSFSPHYNDSYRISANFLNWVTEKYDKNVVAEVGATMRDDKYSDDFWKQHTGKTVEELGAEWKQELEKQLSTAAAADKQGS